MPNDPSAENDPLADDEQLARDPSTEVPRGATTAASDLTSAVALADLIDAILVDDLLADDENLWAPPEDCTDEELGYTQPLTEAERAEGRRARRRARERWRRLPDDDVPEPLTVTPTTIGPVLRAVRRHTRWNQRELAAEARVPRSCVSRAEATDETDLRLSTLVRLLRAGGLHLAVVDDEGTELAMPYARERFRDGADRRLPAHLSTYAPHVTHRSRYRSPGFVGPARVTAGRRRPRTRRGPG